MGAYLSYLSEPITDKEITDEIGDRVICGTSSMQGWRITQEDAHNCIVNYDTNASLFAVYDGHGGHDVAIYSGQHLPKYLKNCEAYKKGDYTQALKDAFLEFDASLIKPEVLAILRQLAKKKKDDDKSTSEEDEEEENVKNLYEEAEMPLEQVMAKYHNDLVNSTNKVRDADKHSCSSGASSSRAGSSSSKCRRSHITAPDPDEEDSNVKKKEDEVSGSSTSSSSKQGESNNGDSKSVETMESEEDAKANVEKSIDKSSDKSENIKVSDKSEDVKLSGKSEDVNVSDKSEDTKVSDKSEDTKVSDKSEDTKVLDKSEDIKVSDKSEDTKVSDKSEDIKVSDKPKDIKAKKDNSGDENSLGVEVNGEIGDEEKKEVNGDLADEGGKGKEKARISPSLRRRCATVLYRQLLENQDNSDSDSDDEGDESFQGAENSSDEDDDDDEDGGDNEEEEDENGDDECEDEDTVDDEEDIGGFGHSEKPGLDSGCTAVVALLKGQELYVANAGDSRCVVCRKGQAIEMSLDHKPEDDIERSRILKAGGRVCDGRVNGGLNLSRALGDHTYKKSKDLPPEEQMITALPDVRTLMIDPAEDEFMILACDGIWNSLSSQEVVDFVRERIQKGETKLSNICGELFDHCLAADTFCDGTGCDNMTAVLVQFKPELANGSNNKSVKREASPIESDSNKRLRTEETV